MFMNCVSVLLTYFKQLFMKKSYLLLVVGLSLSMSVQAQTKIKDGTVSGSPAAPASSSILELESNNKGLLGPRVALTSESDIVTIASPVEGLLAYNTGTAGLKYKGYVFWSGSEWLTFNGESLKTGAISNFECNSATLLPSSYAATVAYEGLLSIPYLGGDGGVFSADTLAINGLTAIRSAGRLNKGSGELVYTVKGVPTVSSPTKTSFGITLGSKTCSASVGGGLSLAVGEIIYFVDSSLTSRSVANGRADHWLSDSVTNLPVLEGKIRLDGWFAGNSDAHSNYNFNPRLINISDDPVKIWFSSIASVTHVGNGNIILRKGDYVWLDDGIYLGTGQNMTTAPAPALAAIGYLNYNSNEILSCDLSFDGKWYRIVYFPYLDNNNSATADGHRLHIRQSVQRLQ